MIVTSQYGRPADCGCQGGGGGFPVMPLVFDEVAGVFKSVVLYKVDGVTVAEFASPTPKVQDDDDNLWRHIFCENIGGAYTFTPSDTADDIPGYPLIAYNSDSKKLEMLHSRKENGILVLYWLPIG